MSRYLKFTRKFKNNLNPSKKLIFNLDHILWNTSIEHNLGINYHQMYKYINHEIYDILSILQDNGNSMNIASTSFCKYRYLEYIDQFFPHIKFDSIEIFPSMKNLKNRHIKKIYNKQKKSYDFIIFDNDYSSLQKVYHKFPNSQQVFCKTPIDDSLFKDNFFNPYFLNRR